MKLKIHKSCLFMLLLKICREARDIYIYTRWVLWEERQTSRPERGLLRDGTLYRELVLRVWGIFFTVVPHLARLFVWDPSMSWGASASRAARSYHGPPGWLITSFHYYHLRFLTRFVVSLLSWHDHYSIISS